MQGVRVVGPSRLKSGKPGGPGLADPADAAQRRARSPLVDLLPTFDVWGAWFTELDVSSPTIDAGVSAWYGLRRIHVDRDTGQEVGISGFQLTLLPADVDGAADLDALGWGSTTGIAAAIVIGTNLPITAGGWSSGPAHMPGIEDAAPCHLSVTPGRRYIHVQPFPTGKFTDTVPAQVSIIREFGAFVYRVPVGSTIDVALVCRRAQVHAQSGKIYGYADCRLKLGNQISGSDWLV